MIKNQRHIAFCIAGLGLGNATRTSAIIDSIKSILPNNNIKVTIFTWGKAHDFLSQRLPKGYAELVELRPYVKANEANIYDPTVVLMFPWILLAYAKNGISIFRKIYRDRPDVAVFDSDFQYFPFLLLGVPTVSISQAPFVVNRWMRSLPNKKFVRYWLRFVIFEIGDFALNLLFSGKILAPSITPFRSKNKKVRSINLIVRKNFLDHGELSPLPSSPLHKVGVIRSGSGLAKSAIDQFVKSGHWIDLNASSDPPGETGLKPVLDRAEIIFTQGGLSSISECIARKKQMIVMPIELHPEQLVNSRELMRLGIAISTEDFNAGKTMPRISSEIQWPDCNGAEQAADQILRMSEH